MGKRHAGLKFMPGKFVFPGGRIEAGDRSMAVTGALHPRAEQALMARVPRPSAQRGRALALAAIRETFEETGLLLGTRDYGGPDTVPAGTAWAASGSTAVFPDLEALHVVARAITPPKRVQALRHPLLRRRPTRHRRRGRGRRRAGYRAGGADLGDDRRRPRPSTCHRSPVSILASWSSERRGFGHQLPVPFFHQKRGRSCGSCYESVIPAAQRRSIV